MIQPQHKLSVEQANLAFDILDAMQKHFPENPELTITALKVVLEATESSIKALEDSE
jgi:hypothetical protein